MTETYGKFKQLLDELFQFDRADLDFGIYRIMNSKREEVSNFLDNELLPQVQETFAKYRAGDEEQKRERMTEIEQAAARFNADPEADEEYQQLKAELAESKSVAALEDEVYSDLYTFFRRYYKNGDFLSLRRYKEGTFAIPYEGEEVKLYWANADQYYVKTTESFRDYRFRLPDDRHVHFRLAAAGTERDNNKAQNERERRFVLREETPVEEADGELNVYFEYRPHADNQKTLNEHALERIFDASAIDAWTDALRAPMPTQSDPGRTTLEKHLGDYTVKNSFDYFIHKSLGRFLRRELDFYLKNEVLNVDDLDVENANRAVQSLEKLGVMKQIGHKIIAFLAQIEDFQIRLFEKKKFVVQADYCLTLDNVPEDLYVEVTANDDQYEEWEKLFFISEIDDNLENGSGDRRGVEWLKANPYLILDTRFFSQAFKERLFSSIENLDEKTEGLLINSENFQALNLLQERYRGEVKCVYIDPPYNATATEIIYKNGYKHSSWLSLISDRLRASRALMDEHGILCVTIDDYEYHRLQSLLLDLFGEKNYLGTAVIRNNPSGRSTVKGFAINHEYALYYSASEHLREIGRLPHTEQQRERYGAAEEINGQKRQYEWENLRKSSAGSNRMDRPKQFYPIYYDRRTKRIRVPQMVWQPSANSWTILEEPEPDEVTVYPLNSSGTEKVWQWGHERVRANVSEMKVLENGAQPQIYKKKYWNESGVLPRTWWDKASYSARDSGTATISSLFGDKQAFDFPKAVDAVADSLRVAKADPHTISLDFFAGSGTSGHAIINLNREDSGNRKYILIEMGAYFDTVLKPRIQKVIYSKDWRNGKPVSREGSSHIFKYIKLESYEDTLNNIALNRRAVQQQLVESDGAIREEYILSYMLDHEASGSPSLLNSEAFEQPFAYRLKVSDGNETRLVNVDMVETFNYLLGLTVERVGFDDGFRTVEGQNRQGERVLVIWRDLGEQSNADLDEFFARKGYGSRGEEETLDLIYVNGDNNLENLKGTGERWKTLLIEEEFRRSMFGSGGNFGSLVGVS